MYTHTQSSIINKSWKIFLCNICIQIWNKYLRQQRGWLFARSCTLGIMATFLAVPTKKTWEVDLTKPLKNFIASTYNNVNADEYSQALSEFNKLRQSMIAKSVDRHESALEVLYRWGLLGWTPNFLTHRSVMLNRWQFLTLTVAFRSRSGHITGFKWTKNSVVRIKTFVVKSIQEETDDMLTHHSMIKFHFRPLNHIL